MVPRSMTQMGQWARRGVGGALLLALAGLPAPAVTTAMVNEGNYEEEVIYVEGEAPWNPLGLSPGGYTGSMPSPTSGGDGGGGGGGGGGVGTSQGPKKSIPGPDTIGQGPRLKTLKDLGFECNGGVGPADIQVCHSCAATSSGTVCICYDCQVSSGKCTPVYDCTGEH